MLPAFVFLFTAASSRNRERRQWSSAYDSAFIFKYCQCCTVQLPPRTLCACFMLPCAGAAVESSPWAIASCCCEKSFWRNTAELNSKFGTPSGEVLVFFFFSAVEFHAFAWIVLAETVSLLMLMTKYCSLESLMLNKEVKISFRLGEWCTFSLSVFIYPAFLKA